MKVRSAVAVVLALAVFGVARADDDEVKRLRKQLEETRKAKDEEIDLLHQKLNKEIDDKIELMRASENAKRELLDKLDEAEKKAAQLARELEILKVKNENLEKKLGGAKEPALADDPDAAVRAALAKQKLSFIFDETPLDEVVRLLTDFTGLNYVACTSAKVTLTAKDLGLKDALDKITDAELSWELKGGIIYILPRKEPPELVTVSIPKERAAMFAKRVTFNFDETPLEDVIDTLKEMGVEGLTLTRKAKAKGVKVMLRLKDVSQATALDALARAYGLAWRVDGERVVIDAK